jgi:hypothetical protein
VTRIASELMGMFVANALGMAMRTFTGSDGQVWTVWLARAGSPGQWHGAREEWLVFQNAGDTERRRLLELPPDWEHVADTQLDVMRCSATVVVLFTPRHSPAAGVDEQPIRLEHQGD